MKLSHAVLTGILCFATGAGGTYFLMKEDIKRHYQPDGPALSDVNGVDLTPAQAAAYVRNYGRRVQYIAGYQDSARSWVKRDSLHDTRCVWFPKGEISQLDSIMRSNDTLSGLRIYLAAYDFNYHEQTAAGKYEKIPPMAYWNRTTLIMVPTYDGVNKQGDSIHIDFITREPRGKLLAGKAFLRDASPENKGELCPPGNCPEKGALLMEE